MRSPYYICGTPTPGLEDLGHRTPTPTPVASLGLVSPGAATDGVTHFFLQKADGLFSHGSTVSPLFFASQNRRPFLLITDFTRVSPPWTVSPRTFFTSPSSFLHYSL